MPSYPAFVLLLASLVFLVPAPPARARGRRPPSRDAARRTDAGASRCSARQRRSSRSTRFALVAAASPMHGPEPRAYVGRSGCCAASTRRSACRRRSTAARAPARGRTRSPREPASSTASGAARTPNGGATCTPVAARRPTTASSSMQDLGARRNGRFVDKPGPRPLDVPARPRRELARQPALRRRLLARAADRRQSAADVERVPHLLGRHPDPQRAGDAAGVAAPTRRRLPAARRRRRGAVRRRRQHRPELSAHARAARARPALQGDPARAELRPPACDHGGHRARARRRGRRHGRRPPASARAPPRARRPVARGLRRGLRRHDRAAGGLAQAA